MDCCYSEECGGYAVSPTLMPSCYPHCESHPVCYPCLPQCHKVVCPNIYCGPPPPPGCAPPRRRSGYDDCERYREREQERCCEHEHDHEPECCPPRCRRRPSTQAHPSTPRMICCPVSSPSEPVCCKPVRTKYVIPCYRYEDGRIERYVPTRHGRLPMSAYRRNGIQDQIYGYRGAIRYLCAGENPDVGSCVLHKNQPTLLMRRACEVAVGKRHRKKPFVVSSDYQDPYNEVHKYHCEDGKGNFCFHIERKKPITKTEDTDSSRMQPHLPHACSTCATCPHCAYTDSECVQAKAVDGENCCYFCK